MYLYFREISIVIIFNNARNVGQPETVADHVTYNGYISSYN